MFAQPSVREAAAEPWEAPDIETASPDYARRFAGPAGAWLLDVQGRAVLRLLRQVHARTVLDVGGGHAQLTPALIRDGYDVTVAGSDPSCAAALAPWIEAGRCRFVVGHLLDLPMASCGVDAVIGLRLLAHMRAWRHLIAELTRVARHAVIVDYPAARSLNVLSPMLFGAKRRVEGNTRPYATFADRAIAGTFAARGFGRAAREAQLFWPMAAHRVVGQPLVSAAVEAPPRWVGLTRWFGSPVLALFTRPRAR